MKVIISGCHAGPNPSPGLGTAFSLREAFPSIQLIGKDHSLHCSALHHKVFDDIWLCRPWGEIDLNCHYDHILEKLSENTWFISGLDLEASWLAGNQHEKILVPDYPSLAKTFKPGFQGVQGLPVHVPAAIHTSSSEREIHTFCRRFDWNVWLKGEAYEAKPVRNWTDFSRRLEEMSEVWGSSRFFLQQGIRGREVAIAYAAYKGELLDAVFMKKHFQSAAGKTWSGAIHDVPSYLLRPLREIIRNLNWTGGGELEFVCDTREKLWLIDWNPRFPAWIHGATLTGRNLPATLIAAVTDQSFRAQSSGVQQFTRVVTEIPVRGGWSLPSIQPVRSERIRGGKHPSGMPTLMRQLRNREPEQSDTSVPEWGDIMKEDITTAASLGATTPYRCLLTRTALRKFDTLATTSRNISDTVKLTVAYSVKTNPAPHFMDMARQSGFMVEVTSNAEARIAAKAGFSSMETICNGPLASSNMHGNNFKVIFADSLEGFNRLKGSGRSMTIGMRIRPPGVDSRFGIPVEDGQAFVRLIEGLEDMPPGTRLGISFHMQSSAVGMQRWQKLAESLVEFAQAIYNESGRKITLLDLGGGFAAEDIGAVISDRLPSLISRIQAKLPFVEEVIIEPGKALVEPCCAVVSEVVEIRKGHDGQRTVVVDASISELPLMMEFPHRVVALPEDKFHVLGAGGDMIVGRLCMEDDILAQNIHLPEKLDCGDKIVFCDSGAYDASMSYSFGLGKAVPMLESRLTT